MCTVLLATFAAAAAAAAAASVAPTPTSTGTGAGTLEGYTTRYVCAGDEYFNSLTGRCRRILACGLLGVDYTQYGGQAVRADGACYCTTTFALAGGSATSCGACAAPGASRIPRACVTAPLSAAGLPPASDGCAYADSPTDQTPVFGNCSTQLPDAFACVLAVGGLAYSPTVATALGGIPCGLAPRAVSSMYSTPRFPFAGSYFGGAALVPSATVLVDECGALVDPRATLLPAAPTYPAVPGSLSNCVCMPHAMGAAGVPCAACVDGFTPTRMRYPSGVASPYSICAAAVFSCPTGALQLHAPGITPLCVPFTFCGNHEFAYDVGASYAANACVCTPGYAGQRHLNGVLFRVCTSCDTASGFFRVHPDTRDGRCLYPGSVPFGPADDVAWVTPWTAAGLSPTSPPYDPTLFWPAAGIMPSYDGMVSAGATATYAHALFASTAGALALQVNGIVTSVGLFCGQAVDFDAYASPEVVSGATLTPDGYAFPCICIAGAAPLQNSTFGCACSQGVYDALTHSCVPTAVLCGRVAVDASIHTHCACAAGTAYDTSLQQCVCPVGWLWSNAAAACVTVETMCPATAHVDLLATRLAGACVCDTGRGNYYEQADGRVGCGGCSVLGAGTPEPDASLLHYTTDVYSAYYISAPAALGDAAGGDCESISSVCGARAHLDLHATIAAQLCVCASGWAVDTAATDPADAAYGCTARAPTAFMQNGLAFNASLCGTGVDVTATLTPPYVGCVCLRSGGFLASPSGACTLCAPPASATASTYECSALLRASCGWGVDVAASSLARALPPVAPSVCVCDPSYAPLETQPSGRCEECAAGYTFDGGAMACTNAVVPAAPGAHGSTRAGKPLAAAAAGLVYDTLVTDAALRAAGNAAYDCRETWRVVSDAVHMGAELTGMYPLDAAMWAFPVLVAGPDAARYACVGFGGCAGFGLAYTTFNGGIADAQYYTTDATLAAAGAAGAPSPPPFMSNMFVVHRVVRWFDAACPGGTRVAPDWYYTTWDARLGAAGLARLVAPVHGTPGAPPSGGEYLRGIASARLHWLLEGAHMGLLPNPSCYPAPSGGDWRDGCRTQHCPLTSSCPDGTYYDASHGWCLYDGADGTFASSTLWVAGVLPVGCYAGTTDGAGGGACVYGVPGSDAPAMHCACAASGWLPAPWNDVACSSGATLPCAFNDAHSACGVLSESPAGIVCASGFYGEDCSYFDAAGVCGVNARCSAHGVCTVGGVFNATGCICEPGYYGATCDTRVAPSNRNCGPYGVAVMSSDGISMTCSCAVLRGSFAPLSGLLDGLCQYDYCGADAGGPPSRHGTLVLDAQHHVTTLAAPFGHCVCDIDEMGQTMGGPLCDVPVCPDNCGLPAYVPSVCYPCAAQAPATAASCAASSLLGGACDCDSDLPSVAPWLLASATARYTWNEAHTACEPYCLPPAVWNGAIQECICVDAEFTGSRCAQDACPNGATDGVNVGVCVTCDVGWRLSGGACNSCAAGYTGVACDTCTVGYFAGAVAGTCVSCAAAAAAYCDISGTQAASCPSGGSVVPSCACAATRIGARCDMCAPGFYRAASALGPSVDACLACATLLLVPSTLSATCPGETSPGSYAGSLETCVKCAAGFDASTGCLTCAYGYMPMNSSGVLIAAPVPGAISRCIACSAALGCDPHGTVGAMCPLWMMPLSPENICVCDAARGIGGSKCDECNTAAGWTVANFLSSGPLACRKCGAPCSANGHVVCGSGAKPVDNCVCYGGWSGVTCEECPYCGIGSACNTGTAINTAYCACRAGYTYAADLVVGTPDFTRAICATCAPGYLAVGESCVEGSTMCGIGPGGGLDIDTTIALGVCTCASNRLPWPQVGGGCSKCASGYYGPDCVACDPPCGTGAVCQMTGFDTTPQCVCAPGYAGANCAQCATGFVGYPACASCVSGCAASGGSCHWNANRTTAECHCPAGSTNAGAIYRSPCRHCHAGETPLSCIACPSCVAGSTCIEVDGQALCRCDATGQYANLQQLHFEPCAAPYLSPHMSMTWTTAFIDDAFTGSVLWTGVALFSTLLLLFGVRNKACCMRSRG